MAKHVFCILTGIILMLILGVAKDEMHGQHMKMAAHDFAELGYTESFCQISSDTEARLAYLNFDSVFDGVMATDIKLCEGTFSALSFSRNICTPKTLKLASTIRILSSLNTQEKGKNLYSNINYVKSSYRYFVYTLRNILI